MRWPEHTDPNRAASLASSSKKPPIPPRLNVGKAPRKFRPDPVQMGHDRMESLHLEPIVIPPRNGDMPEAVQVEYHGSLESRSRTAPWAGGSGGRPEARR
jgi:hypothetical protein